MSTDSNLSLSNISIDVKKMHELLLAYKPSEASHDASLCPLCEVAEDGSATHDDTKAIASGEGTDSTADSSGLTEDPEGGDMSNQTFTDEEYQALKAELEALKTSQEQAAVETRINEMTESHKVALSELQAQLDTTTAALDASKAQYDELVAFLNGEAERAEIERTLEARREEVRALAAEIFSDADYIETRLDEWASLSAEDLEARFADFKVAAKASLGGQQKKEIVSTAMKAGLDSDSEDDLGSVRRDLLSPKNRRAIASVGPRH